MSFKRSGEAISGGEARREMRSILSTEDLVDALEDGYEELTLSTVDEMPAELFEDSGVQTAAQARLRNILSHGDVMAYEIDHAPQALYDFYETLHHSPELHEEALRGFIRSLNHGSWEDVRTIYSFLDGFTPAELESDEVQEVGRGLIAAKILNGDHLAIEIGKRLQSTNKSVERAMVQAMISNVSKYGGAIERLAFEFGISPDMYQTPNFQEAAKQAVGRALSEGHWQDAERIFEKFQLRPEHALGPEMFEAATEGLVKVLSSRDDKGAIYRAFQFIESYGLESVLSSPMVQAVLAGHKRHGDMMKRSEKFSKYLHAEE
ncbi:hypothetical protein KBA73_01360 [Patescibacteria group bacterium]|nr:hypothetical protein [Patescibacteria group bacterium]